MQLSRETKIVSGLILIGIPSIMYGGITLLGLLTSGEAGIAPGNMQLSETQWSLWRAGHAHAGVWVILSLIIQILVDATRLTGIMHWTARLGAPVAALLTSGGFFGLAFASGFQWLIYLGGVGLVLSVLITGVGLLMNRDN